MHTPKGTAAMQHRELVDDLMQTYDVIVNNEYHIQIVTVGGKHDIWFTKKGVIKFKAYGQQEPRIVSEPQLKSELAKYKYEKSDLGLMRSLSSIVKKAEGKTGIFVDAGFREGHARVAILRGNGRDYDIAVRQIEVATNVMAEDWAIKKAIEMYDGDEPVHSDCEPAVRANQPRARWIPRGENKEADHLGNMRKSKKKKEDEEK